MYENIGFRHQARAIDDACRVRVSAESTVDHALSLLPHARKQTRGIEA